MPFFAEYIHSLSPFLLRFSENWGIRWYGLSYVLAFVAAFYLLRLLIRKNYSEMHEEKLGDFITWSAIFGVAIGGRLGYMLFYTPKEFFANPAVFFRFLDGGMSSHGGIYGLALFTLYFAWRHGYHWRHIGDNLCAVAPAGIAIVRCANFINGELWGKVTTPEQTPWAMKFPSELGEIGLPSSVVIEQAQAINPEADSFAKIVELSRDDVALERIVDSYEYLDLLRATTEVDPAANNVDRIIELSRDSEPLRQAISPFLNFRYPSQIYQALLEGLALFAILFAIRLKWRALPYGILTALFFIFYATFRIIGEKYRHADAGYFANTSLSMGQFYSLFMFGVGAVFIGYAIFERRKGAKPLKESRLDYRPKK